jgi:hypothetical protein
MNERQKEQIVLAAMQCERACKKAADCEATGDQAEAEYWRRWAEIDSRDAFMTARAQEQPA